MSNGGPVERPVSIWPLADPQPITENAAAIEKAFRKALGATDPTRHRVTIAPGVIQHEDTVGLWGARARPCRAPKKPGRARGRSSGPSPPRSRPRAIRSSSRPWARWNSCPRGSSPSTCSRSPRWKRARGITGSCALAPSSRSAPRGSRGSVRGWRGCPHRPNGRDRGVSLPLAPGASRTRRSCPHTSAAPEGAENGASGGGGGEGSGTESDRRPPHLCPGRRGTPQFYLSPYYPGEDDDDLILGSACELSLVVNVVPYSKEDPTQYAAIVQGGSGQYRFDWGTMALAEFEGGEHRRAGRRGAHDRNADGPSDRLQRHQDARGGPSGARERRRYEDRRLPAPLRAGLGGRARRHRATWSPEAPSDDQRPLLR